MANYECVSEYVYNKEIFSIFVLHDLSIIYLLLGVECLLVNEFGLDIDFVVAVVTIDGESSFSIFYGNNQGL